MSPASTPSPWLPVVVTTLATLTGGLFGAAIAWSSKPDPVPVTVEKVLEVPRNYTEDELEIACLPLMRRTATTLDDAQTRVTTLEEQIRDKTLEIAQLETTLGQASRDKRTAAADLEFARSQLNALSSALQLAVEDKERLLEELASTQTVLRGTRVQLADAVEAKRATKEDVIDQAWSAFTSDATLQICDSGSKRKVEACRASVAGVFDTALRNRFATCIRQGEASPVVRVAERGTQLPSNGLWLGQEDRFLKDHYVLLCDPALPESSARRDVRNNDDNATTTDDFGNFTPEEAAPSTPAERKAARAAEKLKKAEEAEAVEPPTP